MLCWFRFHCDLPRRAVLMLAGEFGGLLKRALSISEGTTPRASAQMNEHAREKWAQFSHISTHLSTPLSSFLQINALIEERQEEGVRLEITRCVLIAKQAKCQILKSRSFLTRPIAIFRHNNNPLYAKQSIYCVLIWCFSLPSIQIVPNKHNFSIIVSCHKITTVLELVFNIKNHKTKPFSCHQTSCLQPNSRSSV